MYNEDVLTALQTVRDKVNLSIDMVREIMAGRIKSDIMAANITAVKVVAEGINIVVVDWTGENAPPVETPP